jgi:hypothetical protein
MKSEWAGGRVWGEGAAGVRGETHGCMHISTCIYTNKRGETHGCMHTRTC